ncbi:MAG: MIP family channel protein [Candidatus Sumerlaeales bacterium]|nr:MIP family channel protein [Candidatus Sumerlaeales bacterium]
MKKTLFGECVSEFIGSWLLIFIGCGSVASLVLVGKDIGQFDLSVIWGLSIAMAIYITGGVSGTHINPAVTLAFAVYRDFPWRKVIPYIIAQFLGCFVAAACVYALFHNLFLETEAAQGVVRASYDGVAATAGVFSTYPNPSIDHLTAFFVETLITMILMTVIFACCDPKNPNAPKANTSAMIIGLTVAMIGGAFGCLTGFAMNPARDFGPKCLAMLAGWDYYALGKNFYFWVPIIAPCVGAVLAGIVYDKGVRQYFDTTDTESAK